MAQKDMAEKLLLSYNDVFADIVNVLLFHGERIIDPDELEDQTPRAMYKADGKIRDMERDVAKRWVKNNIRIACIGLENQTRADPYMPLRVMGYDGVEYQTQLRGLKRGQKPSPVVTLVLYFGYKGHWNAPTTLMQALDVPDILRPYVTDVKVNLFEIAYLTWEQVNLFKSDFKEVARYFVQMRENDDYQPSDDEMQHIREVMSLMNVLDKDRRFEAAINIFDDAEEVRSMSEWFTRAMNTSRAEGMKLGRVEGRKEGRQEGRKEGRTEGKLSTLVSLVKKNNLTVQAAAEEAHMTEDEFRKIAGLSPVQ